MTEPQGARRKVLIRVVGAPLLLAALAGVLYVDHRLGKPLAVTVLAALFAVASYRELCAMGRLRGLQPAEALGSFALGLVYAIVFLTARDGRVPALDVESAVVGFVVALLALMALRYGRFSPADAGFSTLAFATMVLLTFVVRAVLRWPGQADVMLAWLGFLVATNKGSDMAAYSFGKLFGRHKMAPVVSPHKTWEGAVGGLVVGGGLGAVVLAGTGLRAALGLPHLGWLILFALVVTAAAQMGDLVKSAAKRWAGVKDSGRLLPEFGGALDMCDSFVLSAPVAWLGLRLF